MIELEEIVDKEKPTKVETDLALAGGMNYPDINPFELPVYQFDKHYDSGGYQNKATVNNFMVLKHEWESFGRGLYGMHIPSTGRTIINERLRGGREGADQNELLKTEVHEEIHRQGVHSEYVTRTRENEFCCGRPSRYDKEQIYKN
ncbi:MAG: hypothetical protein GY861_19820 [bacterium]|nr:hypothetical protein [bacterium]